MDNGYALSLTSTATLITPEDVTPGLTDIAIGDPDGDLTGLQLQVRDSGVDDAPGRRVLRAAQDPVAMASVAFSAGLVWWLTRTGGLMTTMLACIPSWRHADLLPVLAHAGDAAAIEGDDAMSDNEEDAEMQAAEQLIWHGHSPQDRFGI